MGRKRKMHTLQYSMNMNSLGRRKNTDIEAPDVQAKKKGNAK